MGIIELEREVELQLVVVVCILELMAGLRR